MLILDRKREQTIKVDGPCEIKIVRVCGHRVKVGIVADRSVKVLRGEVVERDRRAA